MLHIDTIEGGPISPALWNQPHDWQPAGLKSTERVKVALVGYQRLHAETLQICIERTDDLDIAGCVAADTAGDLENLKNLDARVIVVQHHSTVLFTIDLIEQIRKRHPDVPTIVANVPANPLCVLRFLEAGARGYVYLHESMDQLLDIVRTVAVGQPRLCPDLARPLLSRLVELNEQVREFHLVPGDPMPLSQREQEVALELARGKSNREIADTLFISTGTVKNHVHRILRKLDVKDRQQAGIIYRQLSEQAGDEVTGEHSRGHLYVAAN